MWRILLTLMLLAGCAAPPAPVDMSKGPDPAKWFPANYEESYNRWKDECPKHITTKNDFCREWTVPDAPLNDLKVGYAFFSGGGDRLLVIQSGIHGTEAASGSAVEFYVMDQWLKKLRARKIDVVFIHDFNPWGFRHNRRNDHTNVNLNRNFSVDGSDYRFDNADYRRFRPVFEPEGPVSSTFWGSLRGSLGFISSLISSGFDKSALNNGFDNGQYEFPRGINYGGAGPRPQTAFLREKIGPILARPYKKTLYLDFHTGLGDYGVLAVILGRKPAPGPLWELTQMLQRYRNDGIRITLPTDPGFFSDYGDVIDFVPSLSKQPDRFLAVTMEYGTLGTGTLSQLQSVNRIILENQDHRYPGAPLDVKARIQQDTRDLFNPSEPAWRHKVMLEAETVFSTLAEKF